MATPGGKRNKEPKVMKAQAVPSPTRPQYLNVTRLVVVTGSADSKSYLDKAR